jgi:lipopolysaccharide export system protein LptA
MPKITSSSILFTVPTLLLLVAAVPAHAAGRADRSQAMQIESDALRYEDTSQRSVFTGNVRVNKGSIVMRGARLDIQQDAAGNQLGTIVGGSGAPAFFRQQREGLANEFVEAQANTIVYNSQTGVATLTGNAVFKRLQGTTPMDTVTGQVITYNGNTDIFTVNGGQAPSADGKASGSRVRVTLTSRHAEGEAAPAPNADQALKPSLQLKSEGGK